MTMHVDIQTGAKEEIKDNKKIAFTCMQAMN